MNILIKLTCLIGLVIAPILGGHTGEMSMVTENGTTMEITQDGIKETREVKKEVRVELSEKDGMHVGNVTIDTHDGDDVSSETRTFTGNTPEEVKVKIEAWKEANVKVNVGGAEVIEEIEEEIN